MKRLMSLCIAIAMLTSVTAAAFPASAEKVEAQTSQSKVVHVPSGEEYNGFYYETSGKNAVITGYYGEDSDVVIPKKIGSYTVTAIEDNAFYNQSITSVSIPDTVTSIGDWAFADCTSLTEVIIPDSVKTLGQGCFYQSFLSQSQQ